MKPLDQLRLALHSGRISRREFLQAAAALGLAAPLATALLGRPVRAEPQKGGLLRFGIAGGSHGLIRGSVAREHYTIDPADPTTARLDTHWTQTLRRDDWSVRTEVHASLYCDAERFHLTARVEAREEGTRVHEKLWERSLPRDHL